MLKRLLEHNAGYFGIISNREDRAWGTLFWNPDNPEHHDSNHAQDINVTAGKVADTIAEIEDFYRSRGLIPRIYCDQFTKPPGLVEYLAEQGYQIQEDIFTVMLWDSLPVEPPLRPGITVEKVEEHNRAEAQIIVTGEQAWGTPEMIETVFAREFANPDVQYYLVRVNGTPAATGYLFYQGSLARVENFRTLSEFRRQGCAIALMQHMQQEFTRRGGEGLYLLVDNDIARKLYLQSGFQDIGEVRNIVAWQE